MNIVPFKIKTISLVVFLILWGIAAAIQVFNYSIRSQKKIMHNSRKIAWREGTIPACRGRILDKDGKVLAQNRLQFNLLLKNKLAGRRRKAFTEFLRKAGIRYDIQKKIPCILKTDLTPAEIVQYKNLIRNLPELEISAGYLRVQEPSLKQVIGETAKNDRDEMVGVSGLEKQYDLELTGTPGKISVMLDRHGNWMKDTLRILRQPSPGRDIRLEKTVKELQDAKQ